MQLLKDNLKIKSAPQYFDCAGFSLIEVLITLLIMSIGLLGLASMQIQSIQQSNDSYYRSQASILAFDITERMRANVGNINNYTVDDSSTITSGPNCEGAGAICNADQMASYDLYEWQKSINPTLPSGKASITADDLQYTITIMWDENRNGGNSCTGENPLTCLSFITQFDFQ